jgi:hypothetical protein
MILVWMVIFVKTSIKATIHSIAFMCECTKFLVWLSFMITTHQMFFYKNFNNYFYYHLFFTNESLTMCVNHALTTYGTFTLQIKSTKMLASNMSNNKLLTYYQNQIINLLLTIDSYFHNYLHLTISYRTLMKSYH